MCQKSSSPIILTLYRGHCIFLKQAKPQNVLPWIIFKSPNDEMAISYTTLELAVAYVKRLFEIVMKN
jgi:hypothetical protein